MTSPRRGKDGNIIAPKGLAKAGNKPASVRPTSISERKAITAGLKKLPTRKKGASKKLQTATPLKGLAKAGKTAVKKNKQEKQFDGLATIANRKMARANAARKEYDIEKSNPRLAKKLKAKGRAVMNSALSKPAAKKVNKLEKQADGFEAIAKRKSARTGRGITAKSNPRLFKKLVNKQRAANRIRNRNK